VGGKYEVRDGSCEQGKTGDSEKRVELGSSRGSPRVNAFFLNALQTKKEKGKVKRGGRGRNLWEGLNSPAGVLALQVFTVKRVGKKKKQQKTLWRIESHRGGD